MLMCSLVFFGNAGIDLVWSEKSSFLGNHPILKRNKKGEDSCRLKKCHLWPLTWPGKNPIKGGRICRKVSPIQAAALATSPPSPPPPPTPPASLFCSLTHPSWSSLPSSLLPFRLQHQLFDLLNFETSLTSSTPLLHLTIKWQEGKDKTKSLDWFENWEQTVFVTDLVASRPNIEIFVSTLILDTLDELISWIKFYLPIWRRRNNIAIFLFSINK